MTKKFIAKLSKVFGNERLNGGRNNPFFQKVEKLISSQKKISSFDKVYFIGGIEYNPKNYELLMASIENKTVEDFINKTNYNVNTDNIEVYYFINTDSLQHFLFIIFDQFELFASEEILKIVEYEKVDLEKLEHELVFKK